MDLDRLKDSRRVVVGGIGVDGNTGTNAVSMAVGTDDSYDLMRGGKEVFQNRRFAVYRGVKVPIDVATRNVYVKDGFAVTTSFPQFCGEVEMLEVCVGVAGSSEGVYREMAEGVGEEEREYFLGLAGDEDD